MASIWPPTNPIATSRASKAAHFILREIVPTGSNTTSTPCPAVIFITPFSHSRLRRIINGMVGAKALANCQIAIRCCRGYDFRPARFRKLNCCSVDESREPSRRAVFSQAYQSLRVQPGRSDITVPPQKCPSFWYQLEMGLFESYILGEGTLRGSKYSISFCKSPPSVVFRCGEDYARGFGAGYLGKRRLLLAFV